MPSERIFLGEEFKDKVEGESRWFFLYDDDTEGFFLDVRYSFKEGLYRAIVGNPRTGEKLISYVENGCYPYPSSCDETPEYMSIFPIADRMKKEMALKI